MKKKEKIRIILTFLEENYSNAKCSLNFEKPHELLIATRLSAQCTDVRVNKTTKNLFFKYKTIKDFSFASFEEIKEIINPCGLANKKAMDIINMCKIIIKLFNGKIPNNMEDLLKLPGIGRKSANLILGELFNQPSIIVDTHMKRISNRLGLVCENNPHKIEKQLLKIIPKKCSVSFCHRVVFFGRAICTAKNPSCFKCNLNKICNNN